MHATCSLPLTSFTYSCHHGCSLNYQQCHDSSLIPLDSLWRRPGNHVQLHSYMHGLRKMSMWEISKTPVAVFLSWLVWWPSGRQSPSSFCTPPLESPLFSVPLKCVSCARREEYSTVLCLIIIIEKNEHIRKKNSILSSPMASWWSMFKLN